MPGGTIFDNTKPMRKRTCGPHPSPAVTPSPRGRRLLACAAPKASPSGRSWPRSGLMRARHKVAILGKPMRKRTGQIPSLGGGRWRGEAVTDEGYPPIPNVGRVYSRCHCEPSEGWCGNPDSGETDCHVAAAPRNDSEGWKSLRFQGLPSLTQTAHKPRRPPKPSRTAGPIR
jgi:hypothetical protein